MKRFLVTILSILYMASAMGASVEFHYCMGRNMGANFVHKSDDKCRSCGMHKSRSKGCCHDEHKLIKTAEHHAAKATVIPVYFDAVVPQLVYFRSNNNIVNTTTLIAQAMPNAPPGDIRQCPIYILFRNLRL